MESATLPVTEPPLEPVAQSKPLERSAMAAPVSGTERWFAVDAVRGLAVLGILWMNIPFFGVIPHYAMNPNLPEPSVLNQVWFYFSHVLFEGKMRGLFSMLFGAGVVLLTSRAEGRGAAAEAADIYYRRTIWLIVFGLLHAYLLWDGDILFWYGMLGLFLYPFRRLSGITLFVVGVVLSALMVAQALYQENQFRTRERDAQEAIRRAAAGQPLTEEQTAARKMWTARERRMRPPTPQEVEKKVKEYQDRYWEILKRRARQLINTHGAELYRSALPDVMGFMFIGMGLFKLGVLTGSRGLRFYVILALLGYGIGIPLSTYEAYLLAENNYLRTPTLLSFHMTYNLDRLTVAIGHLSLLMILIKSGTLRWLTTRLAAVGQMALTNYLMQSAICTTLFYGYGFGLYGKLPLYQLTYVVVALWLVQLVISPLWLRFFRFGPMEWLWRSLTYLRVQPMARHRGEVTTP
jgi:uncharacterized protein